MPRHKKRRYILPIRKLAGIFVSSLTGFLLLSAVGAYWAIVPATHAVGAKIVAANVLAPLQTVKVYFGNSDMNKNKKKTDCGSVYPLNRDVPEQSDVVTATMNELLAGLSWDEANAGYFNSINGGTKLNSLTINNNVAYVDFDKRIKEGVVDPCEAMEIRSQITTTLKQFPFVNDVVISVDGKIDEALQP